MRLWSVCANGKDIALSIKNNMHVLYVLRFELGTPSASFVTERNNNNNAAFHSKWLIGLQNETKTSLQNFKKKN